MDNPHARSLAGIVEHMDDLLPVIEGYVVESRLGVGSGGSVWSGHRASDRAPVALKVVAGDPAQLAREVDAARSLGIEHVVRVHEVVPMRDGRVAVVMDLVPGGSLRDVMAARGHLSPGEVVTVLVPIASALGALHRHGVVHSDVSPDNVLFDLRGRPSLADLGACHAAGQVEGDVWGSDGFVAPEVLLGGRPCAASDVYAVAALGLYCLTGRVPEPAPVRAPVEDWLAGAGRSDLVGHPLIDVIKEGLAPDAVQRPEATRWASMAYECAPAEPLLLLRGTDASAGLTRRLRGAVGEVAVSGASQDAAANGRSRWGALLGRSSVPVAGPTRSTPGRHAAAAGAGSRSRRAPARGRRTRGRGSPSAILRRSRRFVVVLTLLSIALVGGGAAALAKWGGRAAGASEPTGIAPTRPAEAGQVRAPAPRASPKPAASSTQQLPGSELVADPRQVRAPEATQVDALVQALADARARAWMGDRSDAPAEAALLDDLSIVGTPARQQDEADLAALDSADRIEGLRFTVRSAEALDLPAQAGVSGPTGTLIVRTRIDTESHIVIRGGRSTSVPAERDQPVDLVLTWTPSGWRVSDVRAVSTTD